jgi:hypothetical protein
VEHEEATASVSPSLPMSEAFSITVLRPAPSEALGGHLTEPEPAATFIGRGSGRVSHWLHSVLSTD